VETIRQAQVDLSLFPCYGKYKVLIIDDAHMLSGSAQNSLLKTLEEPNKTSILILITHEVSRLLPTILSRVHEVNFSLVSEEEMQLGFGVENKNHSDMFFLGMGRPGLVHGIAASLEELEARRDWLKQLEIVQKGSVSERLRLAENFSKNIVRTFERLALWIWSLRGELSRDRSLQNEIYEKIEKIDRAIEILKTTNANSRLVLENLFISL
jgi:DNA polymerase III delta prime subunit